MEKYQGPEAWGQISQGREAPDIKVKKTVLCNTSDWLRRGALYNIVPSDKKYQATPAPEASKIRTGRNRKEFRKLAENIPEDWRGMAGRTPAMGAGAGSGRPDGADQLQFNFRGEFGAIAEKLSFGSLVITAGVLFLFLKVPGYSDLKKPQGAG